MTKGRWLFAVEDDISYPVIFRDDFISEIRIPKKQPSRKGCEPRVLFPLPRLRLLGAISRFWVDYDSMFPAQELYSDGN